MKYGIGIKYFILFLLIVLSYSFMNTTAINGSISFSSTFKPLMFLHPPEGFYRVAFKWVFTKELHTEWLHTIGYSILAVFYGWIIIIISVLDEVMQGFLPHRALEWMDIARNVAGSVFGVFIRFLWKRKKRHI